ncbi:unnamed protein product, partial [Didymodactylos carnosus]
TIPSSGKVITAKSGFQFFATQNDASYANRHQLPVSLRNRFLEVQFGEFPQNELAEIIRKRNEIEKQKPSCLTDESTHQLAKFYHQVISTRSRITFRELVKWLHRHALFSPKKELWPIVDASLLGAKYSLDSTTRQTLLKDLGTVWPKIFMSPNPQIEIKEIGGQVCFREGELSVDLPNMTQINNVISNSPETFHRSLVRLALAIHTKEPVLLIGPTSCKTLLVETWTRLSNRSDELIKVHLTPDTEASDLIGEIQPYSFLDLLKRLPAMAERVYLRFRSLCQHHSSTGQMTKNDEILLKPLLDAINIELPEAIRQFEIAYSRDEERRQKKDEIQDDFAAIRAQVESNLMPTQSVEILTEYLNDTESITKPNTLTQSRPVTYSPTLNLYDSDDYFDASYQSDMGQTYNNDSSDIIDDGFGYSVTSFDNQVVSSTSNINSSTDYLDDGFDQVEPLAKSDIPSAEPVFELDDGFDVLVHIEKLAAVLEPLQDLGDQSQPIILDDGFSNMINITSPIDTTLPSITPSLNPVYETEFPDTLLVTIGSIRDHFRTMLQHTNYASFTAKDTTLIDYQSKFNDVWERLTSKNFDRTKPIFLFNDGPVTIAVKRGGILFLEDLDLPSQAVIERLNCMLEPSPTFALTEDITSHAEKGQLDITLSNQFQIFASVHQEQAHQVLKLSPATRSRFTEIYVPGYSDNDLKVLVKSELIKQHVSTHQVDLLAELMFSLRQKLHEDLEWKLKNDIQLLFRWTGFIINHHNSVSLIKRLFLGARFFYFDQLPLTRHAYLFEEWRKSITTSNNYHEYDEIFKLPTAVHGAITFESIQSTNTDEEIIFPFEVGPEYVALRYTGVRYSSDDINMQNQTKQFNELRQHFCCVPTPTLINQIARIFAATSSKTPLLLEGPPGIGKTQVITQVCSLLNKQCERINLSANTSLDQLIGCIIPRFVNGIQIFQWQEGRVLSVIKAQKWILFDELNLAAPEVLEGLTPLFYRDTSQFIVPTTGEIVKMKNVRLFATMNPSAIGGGRNKLPRSINNLFTIVQLDDYSEIELRIILNRLFIHDLKEKNINMEQLDGLFDMHTSLKALVRQGTLGRTGGPYELNLHDDENINQERKPIEELSQTMNKSDARFLSIRKFAQVVYGCQFQGQDDFLQACEVINSKFPINPILSKRKNDCSIDTSVATVVRIGSIYVDTGREEPSSTDIGLIHTKKTVRQLELLAGAWQSKRAILLEGDICSRKSSLVMGLTRHRLIIIPLHENFETSDLIGSWQPNSGQEQNPIVFNKIDKMFKQIIKLLALIIMPLLSTESNEYIFNQFKNILRKQAPIQGITRYETIPDEIECLEETIKLLTPLTKISQMSNDIKILISCYVRQAEYYVTKLKEIRLNEKQEIGFIFVESEFVQAIREELLLTLAWFCGQRVHQLNITPETEPSALIGQLIPNDTKDENDPNYGKKLIWQNGCVTQAYINGQWVLPDNLGTAESSVLERLNPVLEQKPMLILTEKGDVGEQQMQENYQLVATMTPPDARQQSQSTSLGGSSSELSPALYNRFSVIHMEDISFDVTNDSQELLLITKAFLSDESDIDHTLAIELCRTILKFYSSNTKNFPKFTLRNIIRLFDSTYLLQLRFKSTLDFTSSLWTAYHVTITNQIKS